ncbi:MAG: hypothetical protein ACFE0Q_05715 [Anaerolineae bacterium]
MRELFFLLDWVAQPLYILLAVVVLWYFYRLFQASSEINASYFELERDLANRRRANALTAIIIMAEIGILLMGVQVRAVPFLEAERELDEQALDQAEVIEDVVFVTDTPPAIADSSLNIEVGTPLGDNPDIIVLTPTPTPTPVGTIVPNAPPAQGCEDPRAFLEVPANGQRIISPIVVRGTAYTDDFIEAKIEIAGPQTQGQYTVVSNVNAPVREMNDFNQFSPALYEEGLYQFRLTVFDISRNLVAFCMVNIYITEPLSVATPTPLGG